jgi:hydroxyacylglutathione hydrolase
MISTQKETQNGRTDMNNKITFEAAEENLHFEGVRDVDPRDLYHKLSEVVLIDVRQPDEFVGDLGHIPGARLIVLDQLEEKMNEIPKDRTVVFVCRSGGRSARASAMATAAGLNDNYNLKGGMILWNELHLDTEG